MKMKILNQNENLLLGRKEAQVYFESNGSTPKREELIASIAAHTGAEKNKIVVETIKQRFGSHEGWAYVKIYDTEEQLKKIEPKPKEKKEKKPVEAGAAPASKQEAPKAEKQEKKEEAKK